MPKVLIIEDQQQLLSNIAKTLQESGYSTESAHSLADATRLFGPAIDLVILDLMLPDGNGLDWLQKVRASGSKTPVLILTARDDIPDRVRGLDAGADDYLTKPFALDELLARLRALTRRNADHDASQLTVGTITVDLIARTAVRDGQPLVLQNRQFELLVFLMRHANTVVTRNMIATELWRQTTATWTNVIEVHINQLRKQLDGSGRPPVLHTIRGRGYLLGDLP